MAVRTIGLHLSVGCGSGPITGITLGFSWFICRVGLKVISVSRILSPDKFKLNC